MSGNRLTIEPIKTRVFKKGESLVDFVVESVPSELVREEMIIAVTSKIASLAENRLVARDSIQKAALVEREADVFLGEIGHGCFLTIKEGLFIPSAGIDESNSENGDFILYPEKPTETAKKLWQSLRQRWNLDELGILLTDSRTFPLRRGVTGVCLSYWGFRAIRNMIGKSDIFGRELKMTTVNLADAWSAATVVAMGEGDECLPLAVVHGAQCEFCAESDPEELRIPLHEDLYYPLFERFVNKSPTK